MSPTAPSASPSRSVLRTVRGRPTSDGAGVRLTRLIGTSELSELDPFLLLDEFGSDDAADYLAGFPDHPHRGFETVTYMLEGRMRHRDNQGNSGLLGPGSVQWMTAGRGIVHSEMPEQDHGRMRGFQLWVNLPARDKMTTPRYQDIPPEAVPETKVDGARVRVVAGAFGGVTGPVNGIPTDPLYLDLSLEKNASVHVPLPAEHAAFAYAFEGAIAVGGRALARGELAVLGPGKELALAAGGEPARVLVVAGRPLNEPVVRYGPFVMNTETEIRQAIADFKAGRL